MKRKSVNQTITSISITLEVTIIIFSILNMILIIKGYVNFENNDFLNIAIKLGQRGTEYYTNIERLNELKKIKYAPFEYSESLQTMIITDKNKFYFLNGSQKFNDFTKNTFIDTLIDTFGDGTLFLLLLGEILNIFCALNWGSVKKKIAKLIDNKIES